MIEIRRWWCPACRSVTFSALSDEVFTGDDPVSYYEELLADYGFGPT